jgi:hypothetical protein
MAKAEADELFTWKAHGISMQGRLSVATGSAKEGIRIDRVWCRRFALNPSNGIALIVYFLSCESKCGTWSIR